MRAAITAQIFFDAPAGPTPVRWAARLTRHASWAAACALALVLGPACDTAIAGTLLPERGGSPNADRIASLYTVVLVLAALVFAGVAVALVFALIRYREDRSPVAAQIRGNTRLEIGVDAARPRPLIVFIAVFSITRLGAIEHPDRVAASPRSAAAAGIGHGPATRCTSGSSVVSTSGCSSIPNGASSYRGDGGPGRRDGGARHRLGRRRALVVDPEAGRQVRRDPRLCQPHVVPARAPTASTAGSAPSCAGATTPTCSPRSAACPARGVRVVGRPRRSG